MGLVYLAEQEHPFRRRVALKVIKLGMDTKAVVARFEAERQALAIMDHPNIARVFDAGARTAGRSSSWNWSGIQITDYCDQNHCPHPSGWNYSCRCAMPSSMRTRKVSFTAISNRPTSSLRYTMACPSRR